MTPASGVTHGADTDRLQDIATQLLASAQRVGAVGDTGTASAPVLEEAWAGGDCEAFIGSWQSARQMVEQTETHLRAFAALLLEQAAQQDAASGESTSSGPSGASRGLGGSEPPHGGGSVTASHPSTTAMVTGPTSLLKRLWDSPVGKTYREAFQAWNASDLTYFERIFVPWAAPPEWREKYLDFVDSKTDWANKHWVDKVSDWGPTDFVQGSLDGWSGALKDAQEFTAPLNATGNLKIMSINIGLGNASEELADWSEMIEDPKGWWDGAGSADQAGVVASAIPVGGVAAKGISKSAKEVIDLLSGEGKHGDEVAKHVDDVPTSPRRSPVDLDEVPSWARPKDRPTKPENGSELYSESTSPWGNLTEQEVYDKYFTDQGWDYPNAKNTGIADGFAEKPVRNTLRTGDVIDRLGTPGGNYAAPVGTPFEQRAMPPDAFGETYTQYRVLKPLPDTVLEGRARRWFGQDGGGVQYKFDETIDWYVRHKYLEEVAADD